MNGLLERIGEMLNRLAVDQVRLERTIRRADTQNEDAQQVLAAARKELDFYKRGKDATKR